MITLHNVSYLYLFSLTFTNNILQMKHLQYQRHWIYSEYVITEIVIWHFFLWHEFKSVNDTIWTEHGRPTLGRRTAVQISVYITVWVLTHCAKIKAIGRLHAMIILVMVTGIGSSLKWHALALHVCYASMPYCAVRWAIISDAFIHSICKVLIVTYILCPLHCQEIIS